MKLPQFFQTISYDEHDDIRYHNEEVSHSHLFFQCSYTNSIWEMIMRNVGTDGYPSEYRANVTCLAGKKDGNNISRKCKECLDMYVTMPSSYVNPWSTVVRMWLQLWIRQINTRSRDAIVVHEMFNGRVEMLSLYIRCSTDESRCYRYTLDVQLGNQVLNTTNINFASSKWSDIVDWLLPFTNRNNVTSIGDRLMVDATYGKNATTELTGKAKDILSN
ncbi:hypothetical protein Tco_0938239 [Tanacetum coccineum]|uniref:Uncharacterized protein n=1 Tax=Tanacetum coccineum TaxID=301880 RepID=A0ABQ5DH96_9ASTR